MTAATYTPTLSTDLTNIWRTVQTKVQQGLNFMSEEWEQMEDLQNFKVDMSTRSITAPLDIVEDYGVASISEGGYEAMPSSPAPSQLTLTWQLLNGRFTVTKTARWIQQKSPNAMIEDQIKYQAAKKVQAIGRKFSDMFYGTTTGYIAQTSTAASATSGQAYTIYNGYGNSNVVGSSDTDTDHFLFLSDKFKKGDRVALVRSGALVTNAIGTITAVTAATPSITVTWAGSVTSVAADYIVGANSLENATLTGGTDYNAGMTGLIDICTTASVHSLSSSTIADWSVAHSDTTGSRLTPARIRKAVQKIKNYGGGSVDRIYLAQGVERDLFDLQSAAVRYSDPGSMQMDGSVKYGNVKFHSTRRVPPGWAIPMVSKSLRRLSLLPKPDGSPVWDDADKIADRSAWVFSVDFPCAMVVTNRKNFSYFTGLTES